MSNDLIGILVYLGICVAIVAVIALIIFLKKKIGIKDSEIELSKLIIQLVVHLAKKGEFKFSGDVETVAKYVLIAFNIVDEYEETKTIEEKKALVIKEAKKLCEDNGIPVDGEAIQLISDIVDYFIG
jgi:hypothetical protein